MLLDLQNKEIQEGFYITGPARRPEKYYLIYKKGNNFFAKSCPTNFPKEIRNNYSKGVLRVVYDNKVGEELSDIISAQSLIKINPTEEINELEKILSFLKSRKEF